MLVRAPSRDELCAIEHPSPVDSAWCDLIVPRAIDWYTQQENSLLSKGHALNDNESEIAREMGVQHPELVRVLVMDKFPFPEDPVLATEAHKLGFGSPDVGGFCMGYVVLEKPKYAGKRWLLAHELVHVGQRERLGTAAFVHRYLLELHIFGYQRSPLELEADRLMLKVK